MSKKKSGLGSGLNNTISSQPPKDVFPRQKHDIEESKSKSMQIDVISKRKFSILLSAEENKLIKRVARRHNLSDSSALHFILAYFNKRNPEIL